MSGRDLVVFTEDNVRWRSAKRRVPWNERVDLIDKEFPGARNTDWNVILKDDDVLARLLKDILKVDQIEPGRAGPRPNLDYERGMQTWREMTGRDYSELAFPYAFQLLAKGQSMTQIALKTDISRSRVHRLLRGDEEPSVEDLRSIAGAFGKRPAYFAEYRAEFIMAAIAARLSLETEMSIGIYVRLVRS